MPQVKVRWRKQVVMALACTLMSHATLPAHAGGIPVIDPASIAARASEHAATLAKYVEQIATLKAQLDTARAQLEGLSGTRNLGDIWNNPAIRDALPKDARTVLESADQSYGSISRSVQRIKRDEALTGIYLTDKQRIADREWDFMTAAKAAMESAASGTEARMKQIDNLQAQINQAVDAKAIADLQARLLVEQANVQADTVRMDLLQRELEAERALIDAQKARLSETSFSIEAIRAPLPGAR